MSGRRPRRPQGGGYDNYRNDIDQAADAFGRLPPRTQLILILLAVVGVIAFLYYKQHHQQPSRAPQSTTTPAPTGPLESVHLLLGNPSDARPDAAQRDNYLMLKPYFVLSYNDSAGEPNWVSWRVVQSDLGNAPRKPGFDPDDTLPFGFHRVTPSDYTASGFDRGHMCPHSDRAATEASSFATFVMTNIIPQAPNVNRKAWAQLEMYARDLVRAEHCHLYVIAGPAGRGGVGERGPRDTIGKANAVAVPAACWKVIVAVPTNNNDAATPDEDLAHINTSTRVIAVIMPNDHTAVGEAWAGFRTSPGELERRTGYNFFTRLPPDVASALRSKVDTVTIPPPRPMRHGTQED